MRGRETSGLFGRPQPTRPTCVRQQELRSARQCLLGPSASIRVIRVLFRPENFCILSDPQLHQGIPGIRGLAISGRISQTKNQKTDPSFIFPKPGSSSKKTASSRSRRRRTKKIRRKGIECPEIPGRGFLLSSHLPAGRFSSRIQDQRASALRRSRAGENRCWRVLPADRTGGRIIFS